MLHFLCFFIVVHGDASDLLSEMTLVVDGSSSLSRGAQVLPE